MQHLMEIVIGCFVFVLGSVFASFFGVIICRIPRGQSIAYPPSHCFDCGHELEWYENIPIISFLLTEGKCKNCGASIGLFSLIYEILGGLLPTISYFFSDGNFEFVIKVVVTEILVLAAGYVYENEKHKKVLKLLICFAVYILICLVHFNL